MLDLADVLRRQLLDPAAGWSIGGFGAVAEFCRDAAEPTEIARPLACATRRGAIRFDDLTGVRPVAWEHARGRSRRWSHGVALCLPTTGATGAARSELTELGPDDGAVRAADRTAILFDLGLALSHVDFCVRTDDADLIGVLRDSLGRPALAHGSPAMAAILKAHPHRIAISSVGRVEVFQKIGGPDTGGVSPEGPHTHLLPKLLAAGRAHAATTPIPPGWTPAATLHPANPTTDLLGRERPFDTEAHQAFQTMFDAWAPPTLRDLKRRVVRAIRDGASPGDFDPPSGRHERATIKATLRQLAASNDGRTVLRAWRSHFDAAAM